MTFRDLDWMEDQPNGKEKQNYVGTDRNHSLSGSLFDIEATPNYCAVCSLSGKLIINENI